MNDLPPKVADSFGFSLPSRPRLELRYVEGADAVLRRVGEQYWDLRGYGPMGQPRWAEYVRDIDTGLEGKTQHLALAGAWAFAEGHRCRVCSKPLSLTSRSALDHIVEGTDPGPCMDCSPKVRAKVARTLTSAWPQTEPPAGIGTDLGDTEIAAARRAVLRAEFPRDMLPDDPIPQAEVSDEVTSLAVIRCAVPDAVMLRPISGLRRALHPGDASADYLASAARSGLLHIHPDSPIDAFDWVQPDDPRHVSGQPVLDESYRALDAVHHVRWGADTRHAVASLDAHLVARLVPDGLDRRRSDEMVELARELLVEEALAFLDRDLSQFGVGAIAGARRDQLRSVLGRFMETRNLGQACKLASAAVRTVNIQRNCGASLTAAPNRVALELHRLARTAVDNAGTPITVFTHLRGPLSAMTKTLFDNVLELSAVTSSLRIVRGALPNATTPQNGGFRATTDFPVLRCGECGLPVLPREAWLHVLLGQSLAEEDFAADSLDHADAPGQETWRITHADCTPEQVGRYEISLPTTFREFIGLTADLLNKSWIDDTDLSSLLGEASDLTGRFAPAPVEQLRNSSIRCHGSSWR